MSKFGGRIVGADGRRKWSPSRVLVTILMCLQCVCVCIFLVYGNYHSDSSAHPGNKVTFYQLSPLTSHQATAAYRLYNVTCTIGTPQLHVLYANVFKLNGN